MIAHVYVRMSEMINTPAVSQNTTNLKETNIHTRTHTHTHMHTQVVYTACSMLRGIL